MSYRKTLEAGYIERISDGMIIPPDPDNQYRENYDEWVSGGNTPAEPLNVPNPMDLLRAERDELLEDSDKCVLSDYPGPGLVSDWQTYRQELRDLPATATPSLDVNYELDGNSFTWPIPPA